MGNAAGKKACGVSLAKHLRLSREQGERGRARRLQPEGERAPGGEKGMQWLGGWGSLLVPLVTRLRVTADLLSRRLLVGIGVEAARA